jgi:hypothetical protein
MSFLLVSSTHVSLQNQIRYTPVPMFVYFLSRSVIILIVYGYHMFDSKYSSPFNILVQLQSGLETSHMESVNDMNARFQLCFLFHLETYYE